MTEVGFRDPHVPLLVHQVPLALQDHHLLARACPHLLLVLQIVVTGLLPLFFSLVSLASHQWDPCPQALLPQVTALPLVPHPLNRAHRLQDPSLLVLQVLLDPPWLWLHLHTCQVPHQVDRHQPLMSTQHSSPHLVTAVCPPMTAEGPQGLMTHTDALRHMTEITVLEAGRWRHHGLL